MVHRPGRRRAHPSEPPLAARVLLAAAGSDRFGPNGLRARHDDEPLALDFALLARSHRLTPAVYDLLRNDTAIDPGLLQSLEQDVRRQQLVRLAMTVDLAWLRWKLAEVAGKWAVIKGPVVAERLWPRPQHRQYHDLDVLVSRRDFATVVELLEVEARLLDRNWPLVYEQGRSQLSFRLPHGTLLDLHWDVVHERDSRASLRLMPQDLLDRAVPTVVLGVDVKTFDPADTVLHLAYHAASSGAHRLVWLRDVQLAASAVPDWNVLAARSRATKTDVLVAAILGRVRRVLGSTAAPPVMLGPAHAWWVSLGAAVDQRYPAPYLGAGRTGQTYYRSLRDSPARSAARLLGTLAEHSPGRTAEIRAGQNNPLHQNVPDLSARRRYLSSLTATVA